jgi:hypothetical protein
LERGGPADPLSDARRDAGGETVGSIANYEPFRKLPDVEMRVYDGLPHNICDAVPDRCARDVRDFLHRRFGAG